MEKVTYNELLW